MKLIFLGVSSALTTGDKTYQSNMVLKSESGRNLLIDCGSDIKHSLFEQGMSYTDIDAVYISHLHADHVGGLEWLGFSKLFKDKKKPKLYISPKLQTGLWNNVLSGGMSSLEQEEATLSSYFDIQPLHNHQFVWEKHTFKLIDVFHSISNHKRLPSFGLLILSEQMKVFISTDTRFSPTKLMPIYTDANLIFHDCETTKFPSGQHAEYIHLRTLDAKIKAKMWLYDYDDSTLPHAKKDGFKGFVVRGQSFEI
ncbi:MAG: MBL fold metallo-hydrolase [Gammaproteobacteria bacterium]|nr:MBL fold metallo-hydrolase [Gammaproteobacteria bacterium]